MRPLNFITAITVAFFSLTGCADDGSENTVVQPEVSSVEGHDGSFRTDLKANGEIFSIKNDGAGLVEASYFFSEPPSKEVLANRILAMMGALEIDKVFIEKIGGRLKKNRRLENAEFVLPLTDMDGTVYKFNYVSDAENNFFVINYSSK
ncbi:hypothetical protein [Microbulbifer agarilyticus]